MTRKDDRNQVDFSPPDTSDYQKRIAAAKEGHTPVGGTDMPSVPRLDQPSQKSRYEGVQTRGGTKPMTPEEYNRALASGQAIPGVGGAYQANQPRGFVPPTQDSTPPMAVSSTDGNPVNPPRAEGGLRPETQNALKAVAEANAATAKDESVLTQEDKDYLQKLSEETQDLLHNKQRREYIESQISDELSFDDLLFQQELRQRVPIRKNFVPTFRTPSAAEDLFIKRLISKEEGSPQYTLDRYGTMGLACGLFAINGKPFPDHCNDQKVPTDDLFWVKYNLIMRYPLIVVADLNANFIWFEERVKKLLSLDAIKGF